MLQLLKPVILAIQAFIVPICFVSAWVIVLLTAWSVWSTVRDTATRTRQLHQIPCANCQYFTSSYHLKCTVHPASALTEDAISCMDYEPKQVTYQMANMQNSQR
ncbi:MAG: hypothetical protein IGS48_22420 [Oscillatoriales cyanobacterium C42_A2020_001]|nr:hypothetical protein [Leptolyngbyaceae cyanobacterium C42_A2020_001]